MADHYFGITDTGKTRENNEDTFIAESILDETYITACVIDGVGGYTGGEVASQLAKDVILQHLKSPSGDILATMKEALLAANHAIYKERQLNRDNEQMACVVTLAIADIKANKFFYAHVGDTRLYLFRDNTLVKISHDHSFVGFLEDSGRLKEEEAMQHPKRNEINKALGFDATIEAPDYIETGESPFLPGDLLLLCSDGLTDMLNRNTITTVLNSKKGLADIAKTLVKEANIAGGKDNITVVLVENNKTAVKQTATKPVASNKQPQPLLKEEKLDARYVPEEVTERPRSKSSGAVTLLSILLLFLLGAIIWLLYQYYQNKGDIKTLAAAPAEITREKSAAEKRLTDSINGAQRNEVFVINTAGDPPVAITDSLVISKDSLHIIGNGVTLQRDTNYPGPAFVVSPQTKYLLLDSMTLENFDIGVVLQNNVLHLRNVSFRNCKIPLQYNLLFPPNTPITATFFDTSARGLDTARRFTDTLKKQPAR
jgi:serine/threonine protein phosphatase PrpC